MVKLGGFRALWAPMAMAAALVAGLLLAVTTEPAKATFPGTNGRIAYSSDGDIWAMNPDGTSHSGLTEGPAFDHRPDWSPDGTKVAYASYTDGNFDIYVVGTDGSEPIRLTDDPANDTSPAWSPDGTKLAYATEREDDASTFPFRETDIYVMNSDGSGEATNLTEDIVHAADPAWSPDGTKIAFVNRVKDSTSECWHREIFVKNADGSGGLERVTRGGDPGCEDFRAVSPDWSPDGTEIAYSYGASYRGSALFVIGADGSGERKVADIPAGDSTPAFTPDGEPSWSPDGTKIAFFGTSNCDGVTDEILVVNADGSGTPTRLTNPTDPLDCYKYQGFNAISPDWGTAPPLASPPHVTDTDPNNGDTGVARTIKPTVTFDAGLDPATVNAQNVKLQLYRANKKWVTVSSTPSYVDKVVTVTPTNTLGPQKWYRVVLNTNIESSTDTNLEQPMSFRFTTRR